jgi:hypothetical protein
MEAVHSTEILVSTYKTTHSHNPEDQNLNNLTIGVGGGNFYITMMSWDIFCQ